MSPRVLAARVRPVLLPAGVLLVLAGVAGLPSGQLAGVLLLMLFVLLDRVGPPAAPVTVVGSPLRGPWRALNSPVTRVPSHGTRAHRLSPGRRVLWPADGGAGRGH